MERCHVVAHGAVGRRHDGGRPAHDVIAGKQQIGLLEGERHVIGGMAGRRHRFERPAVAADRLAVGERDVGTKIHVGRGVQPPRLADMQRPRQPVRTLRENLGSGRRLDLRHRRRMIAMGVGDENMRDGLAAHGVKQRGDMGIVVGAGIEDRDFAAADDVAHRALERERSGIIGDHRADLRRNLAYPVGLKVECLIEGDVVAHPALHIICAAKARIRSDPAESRLGRIATARPIPSCSLWYRPGS